jgi:hypothetical protein
MTILIIIDKDSSLITQIIDFVRGRKNTEEKSGVEEREREHNRVREKLMIELSKRPVNRKAYSN